MMCKHTLSALGRGSGCIGAALAPRGVTAERIRGADRFAAELVLAAWRSIGREAPAAPRFPAGRPKGAKDQSLVRAGGIPCVAAAEGVCRTNDGTAIGFLAAGGGVFRTTATCARSARLEVPIADDGALTRAHIVPGVRTAKQVRVADRVAAVSVVTPWCAVVGRAVTGSGRAGEEASEALETRRGRTPVIPLNVAAERVQRAHRITTVRIIAPG